MVEIFRDVLDGKTYTILVVVCIFLILASIGYLVTLKIEEEKKKTKVVPEVPEQQ